MRKSTFGVAFLFTLLVTLGSIQPVWGLNKYALIILGHAGSSVIDDHIEYEVDPMLYALIEDTKYNFSDYNVYSLILNGEWDDYEEYFNLVTSTPQFFWEATHSKIESALTSIGNKMENATGTHLLFIFMPGHQGSGTPYDAYYLPQDAPGDVKLEPNEFKNMIINKLLDETSASDVTLIVVMGSCCAKSFEGPLSSIPDINLYFASADQQTGAASTIQANPGEHSFHRYWAKYAGENLGMSLYETFNNASDDMVNGHGWDDPPNSPLYSNANPDNHSHLYDWPWSDCTGDITDDCWSLLGEDYIPSAPTNLSVSSDKRGIQGVAELTWDDNSSNEDGFKIERKTNNGDSYAPLTTVSANTESYDDYVTAGSTYTYKVYAYDGLAESDDSNEATMPFLCWISGYDWLVEDQQHTYLAKWVGGTYNTSSVTYSWEKDYQSAGSNSSLSVTMGTSNIRLDLDVTKGSHSDDDTKIVYYDDTPPGAESRKDLKLDQIHVPTSFSLDQNYPNPFNPETTIQFDVKEECHVALSVFDIQGRLVETLVDNVYSQGRYSAVFRTNGLNSGIYYYQIQMGDFKDMKKMVVTR